jgi:4-hydroxy-tetrahydrodipicolinate synthase
MAEPPPKRGVFAYPVTPTRDDGERIDEARMKLLLDELVEAGVHGIVILGSTGAVGSFGEEERMALAAMVGRHLEGRLPFLVGTSAMTTAEVKRLSAHAESAGAAGVQVVPMSHWPLNDSEIRALFEEIARAVSIPILVHNCPALTGIDMKPALLARLAEIPNIGYLKEGSGDLSRVPALRKLTGGAIPICQDSETTALQGLLGGAEVWTTMTTNVFPRAAVELFELACVRKDVAAATRLFERMYPVIEFVFEKSGVRALHLALEILGRPAGVPRRPLRMPPAEARSELEKLLRDCGELVRWSRQGTPLAASAAIVHAATSRAVDAAR